MLEKSFGWYTTCMSGGQLLGPLIAGYLIENYSIRASFLAIALIPLFSSLAALFFSSHANRGTPSTGDSASYRAQWGLLRNNRGVQLSLIMSSVSLPLSMVIISETVSREQRAPSLAMRLMGNRLAQSAAPLVVGLLAELYGFPAAFALSSMLLLVLFFFWAWHTGFGGPFRAEHLGRE